MSKGYGGCMNLRKPAAAGTFYPGSRNEIISMLDNLFSSPSVKRLKPAGPEMIGFVSPHAGYIYSGKTAAHGYQRISNAGKEATFIILGPNHYGVGPEISIYPSGEWETPLGNVSIDKDFIDKICSVCNGDIMMDASAHLYEHSIEVQIPFLQYLFGNNFKIVPICMLNQSISVSNAVANFLYDVYLDFENKGKKVFFIASSDFSHYVQKKKAEKDDKDAIEKIKSLDVRSFYEAIGKKQISICGYGPISTLMFLSKKLGSSQVNLLDYSTSADATGDEEQVVGYASIEFLK
jgi:AmmeMemoRadiSam system protein B